MKTINRLFVVLFLTIVACYGNNIKHPFCSTKELNNELREKGKVIIQKALLGENKLNKMIDPGSIAIVTLTTPDRKDFTDLTYNVLRKYCSKWGYKYHQYDNCLDTTRIPEWSKIIALQKVMKANPSYSWIVWVDDDILLTNPLIRLEDFIIAFGDNKDFIVSQDLGRYTQELLNTGIFFMRNNLLMQNFLDDVWEMGRVKNYLIRDQSLYDQSAIIDCIQENLKYSCITQTLPLGLLQAHLNPYKQNDPETKWTPYVFASHAAGMNKDFRVKIFTKLISQGELPLYL